MGIAVTILAICRCFAGGNSPGVGTVRVSILRARMAFGAEDLLGRRIVGKAFNVFVAIHARQLHRAVNGVLQVLGIDEERNGLTVHIRTQACVAMAGETVFVFQFVLGASGESRAQQKERTRTEQYSAGNFHAYEETLLWIQSP